MVSITAPVIVPTTALITLVTHARSQVERAPASIQVESSDVTTFSHALVDRQISGLGEANHGTGEFYTYRGALSLTLARAGRLRTILIEANADGHTEVRPVIPPAARTPLRRTELDGSYFHRIGIQPTISAARAITGIPALREEVLNNALASLRDKHGELDPHLYSVEAPPQIQVWQTRPTHPLQEAAICVHLHLHVRFMFSQLA
jgi:hypothetical protein